jgi:polyisoprenoid-binding protein YceI
MESEKFPNSTFTGVISDVSALDLSKEQTIDVSGNFLLHGINRPMNMTATVSLKDEKLNISSQFDIVLDDFNIDIPKIMMYKIAEVINVNIKMNLQKLSNE